MEFASFDRDDSFVGGCAPNFTADAHTAFVGVQTTIIDPPQSIIASTFSVRQHISDSRISFALLLLIQLVKEQQPRLHQLQPWSHLHF